MPQRAWRWVPLAVSVAAVVGVSAQQPFRASIELVRLPVVVTSKSGQPVHGIGPEGFQITEEGRPQQVSYFVEGAPGAALPLHLGLLLDGSASMDDDMGTAANAAVTFVKKLDEAVDVTLVDFDSTINVGRFTPDNYPRLFSRIRERKAAGGTSLYDALGVFVERTLGQTGQHVVLIYTDGGDSTSTMTYGKLQQLLRLGNVMVYVMGYVHDVAPAERMLQQARLGGIAHETGGEAFFPQTPAELSDAYARIIDELASRYTIGYVPSDPKSDGKFHKVEVKLAMALKGAKVRTRPGYLASTAPPAGDR
ncbi:MAG TPA: VWA domain-containing protein [Vicinamibacterales bacterium]|nr:VWA domain-containing protein [Vicinamibacterales bacterium]